MNAVMPLSIIKQLAKLEHGEKVQRTIEEREKLYGNRPLTKIEILMGYHKCPLCGFPTKNRYRCHGCWAASSIKIEEEKAFL